MINAVECSVDAQNLISISLMKIHNSRTQRGGIKLHKNLLVSCVLRNARQVYVRERYAEIYRRQQYEELMAVCDGIQELSPLDLNAAGGDSEAQARAPHCGDGSPWLRGAAQCRGVSALSSCAPPEEDCRSCCPAWEHSSAHCDKTTVLDLDTHVVTTVENGCLRQDCCCGAQRRGQGAGSAAKKRKVEFGGCASEVEELLDFTARHKRAKREECSYLNLDYTDTSSISTLISIFGSGFSGLLSRQTDVEQICSKPALGSLGAWTRAIVAF